MKLIRTSLAVAAFSLVLSACSGETVSMPSSSESTTEVVRNAKTTSTHPFAVENQLKDWWGGDGIPITWKVSETENVYWDGVSRPDAAPPHGFQGLVQPPFSGSFQSPLEWNIRERGVRFVLTPAVTIDGQSIELEPIRVGMRGLGDNYWLMDTAGFIIGCTARAEHTFTSLSKQTPRGLLVYDVDMVCSSTRVAEVIIRNYQKR